MDWEGRSKVQKVDSGQNWDTNLGHDIFLGGGFNPSEKK